MLKSRVTAIAILKSRIRVMIPHSKGKMRRESSRSPNRMVMAFSIQRKRIGADWCSRKG